MVRPAPPATVSGTPELTSPPARPDWPSTLGPPDSTHGDSVFEAVFRDRSPLIGTLPLRWIGWRLRLLVLAALVACLGLFVLTRDLAATPWIDASWRLAPTGQVMLTATNDPALRPFVGLTLLAMRSADASTVVRIDATALQRSARWIVDDGLRDHRQRLHERINALVAQGAPTLVFSNGAAVTASALPRGFASFPTVYWLLCTVALALYLVAMVVLMARPNLPNLLYALMSLCQTGALVFSAVESTLALGLPALPAWLNMPLRMALDLITAAAAVHAVCIHPRRLPSNVWVAGAAWLAVLVLFAAAEAGLIGHLWWWTQIAVTVLGVMAVVVLSRSSRVELNPLGGVLRRFGIATIGAWVLLSVVLAAAAGTPSLSANIAATGPMIWQVFFASLLMLVPFLSRSQQLLREFWLLAAVSTIATSLDLLFVAVFSLGQFASLTLSLFLSLALYSGARQWIVNQFLGSSMLTMERTFEQLYRIAREVEAHPERSAALLSQLLRELFEPMEVVAIERPVASTRVSSDGATMLVPVPLLGMHEAGQVSNGAIAIRFAQRGRRLFTQEDMRLSNRIVEQLKRAVAFDKAVEQGRSEERLRLAQDLHDDIGARLLTLMYKAQSPEMEEYVRHTLQDLKTLTRGLAAPNHRLSHATAEWKADLSQRLTAADITLGWTCEFDNDTLLSVVQWSALTRVLRELVSNAIAHAQATHVDVEFFLVGHLLDLTVSDNGTGTNPRNWSHGLGLGGVRKRVKQLGGEVEWREDAPQGISCRVLIRGWSARG